MTARALLSLRSWQAEIPMARCDSACARASRLSCVEPSGGPSVVKGPPPSPRRFLRRLSVAKGALCAKRDSGNTTASTKFFFIKYSGQYKTPKVFYCLERTREPFCGRYFCMAHMKTTFKIKINKSQRVD